MLALSKAIKAGLALSVVAFLNLSATDLTVQLDCNSRPVERELEIRVIDAAGTEIPNLTSTEANGTFVIQDVENYTAPFNLFYTAPSNGSMCGAYPIQERTSTEGIVYLQYYPDTLPCSCANLGQ